MRHAKLLVVLIAIVLIVSFLVQIEVSSKNVQAETTPRFFVGVDMPYASLTDMKSRIDQVANYTNFVVIGCSGVTYVPDSATEICQYAYDKGLYFMVYTEIPLEQWWVEQAVTLWGSHFLGLYLWDEPGGKQLDQYSTQALVDSSANVTSYSQVEAMYLWLLRMGINHTSHFGDITLPVAASDYGLYWFDYKAGYDTMFAEFGWNYSRAINVGLVRGAATVQDKEWGVMITWKYTQPPYLESGEELYEDMKYAYDSGAKYVIVFDSNDNWTDGILLPEHFEAMQKFWNYVQANPQAESSSMDRVAYVLPDEYAYGFRGHNEKIWGLFPLDDFTRTLYEGLTNAIDQFGDQLDIIYNDPAFPNYTSLYGQLVFWNGTVITQ